ncbi:acyltransferase family protein [Candidatus Woesebacteria bacterium]|nr:acyltransferase family protein [Candidatus Woesebacteria bacterium]
MPPNTHIVPQMKSLRNTTIDFLRGLAVLLMIFVHATAYFLHDPVVHFLWDYTHVIVPFFVFCSAFVYFQKKEVTTLSISYIAKRLKRLLIPYYLYLLPLFGLIYMQTNSLSLSTIWNNVTWGQGRDVGWLVVLFIYLLVLIPLMHFMYTSHKWLFRAYAISAFISTVVLLFIPSPVPFRFLMWLPWSFFLIYTILFAKHGQNKFVGITILFVSAVVFLVTRDIREMIGGSLVLTENKYPPNLNYLSYGIFFTTLFYYAHSFLDAKKWYPTALQKAFDFLSNNSYSLFFIHFLYLRWIVNEGLHKAWGWFGFFVILVIISSATQLIWNAAVKRFTFARH